MSYIDQLVYQYNKYYPVTQPNEGCCFFLNIQFDSGKYNTYKVYADCANVTFCVCVVLKKKHSQ